MDRAVVVMYCMGEEKILKIKKEKRRFPIGLSNERLVGAFSKSGVVRTNEERERGQKVSTNEYQGLMERPGCFRHIEVLFIRLPGSPASNIYSSFPRLIIIRRLNSEVLLSTTGLI